MKKENREEEKREREKMRKERENECKRKIMSQRVKESIRK
jgi:hypothetical protein